MSQSEREPAAPAATSGSAPAAPDPVRFDSADGTGLYGEFYRAASERGAALIVHGYAEHGGRYREVAQVLLGTGLSALAIDLRGHGRSDGPRGHVRRFTDYVDDIEAGLGELRARCPDRPILLLCHSNGSLAGLRLIADPFRCPPDIRAAVLSSPFLRLRLHVSLPKRLMASVASRLLPAMTMPSELHAELLTTDPEKIRERQVDTLCHEVAGVRYFTEAADTQEWVQTFVHRIAMPTLWLVAGGDQIVDHQATLQVQAAAGGEVELEVYEGMQHEVFNELDRARVFDRLRAFVSARF